MIFQKTNGFFFKIVLLLLFIFFILACERLEIVKLVKIVTRSPESLSYRYAIVSGAVIDFGEGQIIQHGHCWAVHDHPSMFDATSQHSSLGSMHLPVQFSSYIDGLIPGTTYYYCSYCYDGKEAFYGQIMSFYTTPTTTGTITTSAVQNVSADTAQCGGVVANNGGDTIIARGVCWNTSPDPTIVNKITKDGNGVGSFTSIIRDLIPDIIYYVRAYATNSNGTSYGNEINFHTRDGKVTITTSPLCCGTVSAITAGGTVHDDGGSAVTSRGICWNDAPGPGTDDSVIINGTGRGAFSCVVPDLILNKRYYFRAFATNSIGTFYGDEIEFNFYVCGVHRVNDFEGNEYNTVPIGKQCWMKENLKTTSFADGTPIADGTTAGDITGNYTGKYWFVYNDEEMKKDTFGLLYTWATAMNSAASTNANPSGIQGICPDGWHLPSNSEWSQLIIFLGGTEAAGGKMKETGTLHWKSPNAASNSSGFTALAAGLRYASGGFGEWKFHSLFQTATEADANLLLDIEIFHEYESVYNRTHSKADGLSVRCIKD
jgi:uncharacterized protein (TIGR02145 family)